MVSTRSSEVNTGDKRKVDEPTEGTSPAKLQKTGGEADVTNSISVTEEKPPADPAATANGAGEAVSSAVDSVKEKAAEILPDVGDADKPAESTTAAADTSTEESAPVTATEKVAAAVTAAVEKVQEVTGVGASSDSTDATATSTEKPAAAAVDSAADSAAEKLGTADAVTAEPERAQAS